MNFLFSNWVVDTDGLSVLLKSTYNFCEDYTGVWISWHLLKLFLQTVNSHTYNFSAVLEFGSCDINAISTYVIPWTIQCWTSQVVCYSSAVQCWMFLQAMSTCNALLFTRCKWYFTSKFCARTQQNHVLYKSPFFMAFKAQGPKKQSDSSLLCDATFHTCCRGHFIAKVSFQNWNSVYVMFCWCHYLLLRPNFPLF